MSTLTSFCDLYSGKAVELMKLMKITAAKFNLVKTKNYGQQGFSKLTPGNEVVFGHRSGHTNSHHISDLLV